MLHSRKNFVFLALVISVYSSVAEAELTKGYKEVVPIFSRVYFRPGVGSTQGGFGKCTGTFLTPRLLLTAAHCVADIYRLNIDGQLSVPTNAKGEPIPFRVADRRDVYLVKKGWFWNKKVKPIRIYVSKYATAYFDRRLNLKHVEQDLAILEFSKNQGRPRALESKASQVGDEVVLVGFGRRGPRASGRKNLGENIIALADFGFLTVVGDGRSCAYDNPPREQATICVGDSGGPLLNRATGGIVGVASTDAAVEYPTFQTTKHYSNFIDLSSAESREFIEQVMTSVR